MSEVKVSRPGYDVTKCADHQLSFSSEWPLLKIEKTAEFLIEDTSVDTDIYVHDLGYYPAFWVFVHDLIYPTPFTGSMISFPGNAQFFAMTDRKLRWIGGTGGYGPGTLKIRFYIFRQDLLQKYTAPSLITGDDVEGEGGIYAIRVSKDGKSTDTGDKRDLSVDSSCKSLMIHKTGMESYAGGGLTVIQVEHNLGYNPSFLFYGKLAGNDYYQQIFTADDAQATSDSVNVQLLCYYNGDFSYIIFKDPLL